MVPGRVRLVSLLLVLIHVALWENLAGSFRDTYSSTIRVSGLWALIRGLGLSVEDVWLRDVSNFELMRAWFGHGGGGC